ncbi:protease FtsH subunit HflC [Geoalkalibacter ferrihydriticus]|uniref:Protein HflC n=2 Tax=Geoalkalibacter ferrihydriticus TaxID=392333 RepID=A0A0C2EGH9_9BACT|nr:protease modulator HflC [Geoalkalibacter ferrihydriticus]KIH77733.1 membrane protein [Geoalkalibacter ferrihydriticus DSM 17813]SDL76329.1 protease FtsH subunit HflC [Geoalkalibacter ferrihydriticus]
MKKEFLIIVAVVAFVLAKGSLFVVDEGEQALVTQFGKPVGEVRQAGLHFKIPLVQDVHRFQRRIMQWDGDPNQIPTKDMRYIWVDVTARWRITDPLLFYTTVANERGAQSRLDDILDSVVRDAVSGHLLVELVRGTDYVAPRGAEEEVFEVEGEKVDADTLAGREQILAQLLEEAQQSTPEYGIELIDLQIKRINYVEQVRQRVYERMISERKQVAAQYRSEGEGERADILGQMGRELRTIESEAFRSAEEIRGKADAQAANIYANAYNRDREFYAFVRSLEAYRKSVSDNSRLVISTDSDFYRFFQKIE